MPSRMHTESLATTATHPAPARPARRLPPWLKRPMPNGSVYAQTIGIVAESQIATVCEAARCPNRSECWSAGTATFMIMGDRCTRRCAFCSVATERPEAIADDEPGRLAEAAAALRLTHVVVTAVARDDVPDEGADHFARCVRALRARLPAATVEVLPADMHARPDCIGWLCDARPDVYNHNIETVRRLTLDVRPQARYDRSLEVFRVIRGCVGDAIVTKSGLMVGLGETRDELRRTFGDLVNVGVRMVTIGQYLQPTAEHRPVTRYYPPEEFDALADDARSAGFDAVASGPFVRSSYHAGQLLDAVDRRRKARKHGHRS